MDLDDKPFTNISVQLTSKEPTLKEKTAKGLFWGGISNILQQCIGALLGIVIIRILSPADYGLVSMLAIFTAIATALMDSGFTNALINKKCIKHDDYNAVFWFSVFLSFILYFILFFFAPLIAKFYNQPVLVRLSRLLFLTFIFSSFGTAHNAFLLKNIMAKQRGIIDLTSVLCSSIIGIILAFNGFVFWGLAIQAISQNFIATALRWYFSPWKPSFHLNFNPLKDMLKFSSKILITNVVIISTGHILYIFFGRYYNEKITGYYSQGNKWASLGITAIQGMITSVAQPILANVVDDTKRLVHVFRKMVRFGSFISFPCMFGLAFVAKEFVLIVGGEKWFDSVFFLQCFCIWGGFSFLFVLYTNILYSLNQSNIYMRGMIFISFTQICIVVCLIPFGLKIMTIIFVLSNFVNIFYCHYHVSKLIGMRLRDIIKDVSPFIFASTLSILVAWGVSKFVSYNLYLIFVIKVIIVTILYITIMKTSKAVIYKDSKDFLKGLRNNLK